MRRAIVLLLVAQMIAHRSRRSETINIARECAGPSWK